MEDLTMMKNSMIHVLFLMVAFVVVLGSIAVTFNGAQSLYVARSISLITTMLAIMIWLDIGKLRREF